MSIRMQGIEREIERGIEWITEQTTEAAAIASADSPIHIIL